MSDLSAAERKNLQRLAEKTFESETSAVNPPTRAAVKDDRAVILAARTRVSKQLSRIKHHAEILRHGPQGEAQSRVLADKVMMLPLDRVVDDPNFKNVRLTAAEEELSLLMESMRHEGLKVPVTVIEAPVGELWYVRSGFRRVEAARRLRWRQVPAIVLPADTREEAEYWCNIIENSARQNLRSYEIARAAQIMRDEFEVSYQDFAKKAGYSPEYVDNLLRTIDRLPDAILERWRDRGTKIPVDYYVAWGSMLPMEALREFNSYAVQHPSGAKPIPDIPASPGKLDRHHRLMTASTFGLCRMSRLRLAIESAPQLGDEIRKVGLQIVDFCMGNSDDVAGIYDHKVTKLQRIRKQRSPKKVAPHANLCKPMPHGSKPMPDPDDGEPADPTQARQAGQSDRAQPSRLPAPPDREPR